ncbi:DNA polymerase II large subunit, partial [Candidatus Woesearchaeota archaeon]|nr:DNA polymerase II large subunit [Candidatus Woesearchaeota archaeon]
MVEASPQMQKYFDEINRQIKEEHKIAVKARSKGKDPELDVEISIAKNMAERVLGLISTIAPQIKDSNLVKKIQEFEKQYGVLDWRVAFRIAEEVAKQNICKFETEKEAIEVGIRVGFAYVTVGVVSACLEGFTKLELKKRSDDGREFFSLYFSGPVRNAGGTAAAVCVLIADYVRKKMGYAPYDPTEDEVKRAYTEVQDYHERVTNLQYYPSRPELEFLVRNMPVEVNGEPTEKIEVSNYKNLPRIKGNLIRGGYALIYSSCIPLKAPKLWKALSKWGKDFEMEQWNFLDDFLKIQKEQKAISVTGGEGESEADKSIKVKPDYTYIADLVAGRPVLSYPLAKGGFRLRYGRSRCSGYSGQCLHPATMYVLNKSIAIGTQAKVERPGKGTVFTSCATIEGPIVKLDNGDVMMIDSVAQARLVNPRIKEILFLGDVLVNYGDFFNRAHKLVPPGYCEEWWAQELEKAIVDNFGSLDIAKPADLMDIEANVIESLINKPLVTKISAVDAITISKNIDIPLHPRYTYHWKDISKENFYLLLDWVKKATIKSDVNVNKIILPKDDAAKRVLEELGVPHIVATDYVVIEKDDALAFYTQLGNFDIGRFMEIESEDVLEILNKRSNIKIRDKSGIYIGARMGRPEKAKMRKLKGSPNGLFPVGEEGGKMRSLQAALEKGHVYSGFAIFKCNKCDRTTIYRTCEVCGKETEKHYFCNICGETNKECEHRHQAYTDRKIDINHYFKDALSILGLTQEVFPDMIKGVRGTVNKDHVPEHLAKGILRAKHGVNVNKDGTVRYDCTELPLTHFKSREIDVSVEKLKELGYTKD